MLPIASAVDNLRSNTKTSPLTIDNNRKKKLIADRANAKWLISLLEFIFRSEVSNNRRGKNKDGLLQPLVLSYFDTLLYNINVTITVYINMYINYMN